MIVVCGEALIDMIRGDHAAPGGGPFNTARALAKLGVTTAFLGHLSRDASGRELEDRLEQDGVEINLVTYGPEPTAIAIADVDDDGRAKYRFVVEGTATANLTLNMVPARFDPSVNALHVGSLGFVLQPMAGTLVELVEREHGKRMLMVDPNVRPGLVPDAEYRERLRHVIGLSTVVKASDADLAWIYPGTGFEEAAERILESGVSSVVVTLGAEGAFGAHRDIRIHVPAPRVQLVDTIGAGDAFGAALLAWLDDHGCISPDLVLDEAQLRSALEYACLAAAITCTRAGADPPRKSEMV